MMKCIYREKNDLNLPNCDKEAEYIFMGKSYCKEHMEVRAEEMVDRISKNEKQTER